MKVLSFKFFKVFLFEGRLSPPLKRGKGGVGIREGPAVFGVRCIMKGYTTKSGAGCCWQPGGFRKHCFAGILLLATVSLLPSDSACLTLPDPRELSSCFPKVPCGGTC